MLTLLENSVMFVTGALFVWTPGRVASISPLANGDANKILNPKPTCNVNFSTFPMQSNPFSPTQGLIRLAETFYEGNIFFYGAIVKHWLLKRPHLGVVLLTEHR